MSDEPVSIASVTLSASGAVPDGLRWIPVPGEELSTLLASKLERSPEAQTQVTVSASSILGRCVPPGEQGSDTGLVVGYVQSGKTLSFTAVMALARDNGIPLVIVIAGSSAQLSDQSQKRIRRDLRIDADSGRAWAPYHNPKAVQAPGIEGLLDAWRDPNATLRQRQTVVVTVMKQHTHLRNLVRLLRLLDLSGLSALIIDDEADQASLNNSAQQAARLLRAKESTTYARLMDLRRALPSHSYLQYTATPQAPLLISIIDSLSAKWVEVLEPGDGYTGGVAFFGQPGSQASSSQRQARLGLHPGIVRTIPASDAPSASRATSAAPASLVEALRLFMVGVAAGYARDEASKGNRSMLIHPSQRTADHQTYLNWINDLFHEWRATFKRGADDEETAELADEFRPAYEDLAATVGLGLPSFDDIKRKFRQAFHGTETIEVNRRVGGPPVIIEWGQRYGWILVGGSAMDRGFTVEGLTVTYMPRGLGVGNADTMQQRARFFGYKASYLGYCRVYLERSARQGFEDYVAHEEFMREELIRVRDEQEPLQDWPRRFVLDQSLKPCRDNVLSDPYTRNLASPDEWITPQAYIGGRDAGVEAHNRSLVDAFVQANPFQADDGDPRRTEPQRHLVSEALPLRQVVEGLIADFRVRDPVEADKWTSLKALLGRMLDDIAGTRAVVYQMSGGAARRRGMQPTGRVKQFFQGAAPVDPPSERGTIYPGDREIAVPGMVTVQVHRLNLTNDAGEVVAKDIPFLAVRVRTANLRPLVVQDQAAQVGISSNAP